MKTALRGAFGAVPVLGRGVAIIAAALGGAVAAAKMPETQTQIVVILGLAMFALIAIAGVHILFTDWAKHRQEMERLSLERLQLESAPPSPVATVSWTGQPYPAAAAQGRPRGP